MNYLKEVDNNYKISLRASSQGRSGGGAGKGKRACNYISGIWITPPIPVSPHRLSCQISTNQREAETSTNVNKQWKHMPRVMMSLLTSSDRKSAFRFDFFDADIQIKET